MYVPTQSDRVFVCEYVCVCVCVERVFCWCCAMCVARINSLNCKTAHCCNIYAAARSAVSSGTSPSPPPPVTHSSRSSPHALSHSFAMHCRGDPFLKMIALRREEHTFMAQL